MTTLVLTDAVGAGTARRGPATVEAVDGGTRDGGPDGYMRLLEDALTPAAIALFEDLHRDLRAAAIPFPEPLRARLRPFFSGERSGRIALSPSVLDRAGFIVDPERMRALFAAAPERVAAITIGDVVAFAPDQYRPECIEGIALIGHELVHVAQYTALGRERFLERYFVAGILKRVLNGGAAGGEIDLARNRLEVDAYCQQARICRTLAAERVVPPCRGEVAICKPCPAPHDGDSDVGEARHLPRRPPATR